MTTLRAALPIVAIVALIATTTAIVLSAGTTLGYDYQAYAGAARRVLDGASVFDSSVDVAGGFAIYLYPPPFALAAVPFVLAPGDVGLWAWEALVIAAFVVGVALVPVRSSVRWAILLLGALDWPLLFAIKLGQVGTLLFLLFVIGWRWRDRPVVLGAVMAAGTVVKVQPALLFVWAALTARWRSVGIGVALLLGAAIVSTVLSGPGVWGDYAALLTRVNDPITTPHNFTVGAIAYQAGWPEATAAWLQVATVALAIVVALVAIRVASAEVSYLTTVVASQLLSPLLWDHYAVVLLLPVAWLLERRQWWAVAIPLLTSLPLIGLMPPVVYPIVFAAGLLGPLAVDLAGRRSLRLDRATA